MLIVFVNSFLRSILTELRLQVNKDLYSILLRLTHTIPIKWLLLHALMLYIVAKQRVTTMSAV